MIKEEKEYLAEFGDVPKDPIGRLDYILKDVRLSKCKTKIYEEISRINSINWKKLSYTIYLLPKATPRPRLGKGGVFYVKGSKNNKKIMEKFLKEQDITLITTSIKFNCVTYYPIPKSMHPMEKILSELGFIRPLSKPDWDNVAKAYCDMIIGYLIYDDSQIIEGSSSKFYSSKPRIEIELEYMDDYDCAFNRRKFEKKG
jgi:Holliday junction resolvase RusA-like endonuclease